MLIRIMTILVLILILLLILLILIPLEFSSDPQTSLIQDSVNCCGGRGPPYIKEGATLLEIKTFGALQRLQALENFEKLSILQTTVFHRLKIRYIKWVLQTKER